MSDKQLEPYVIYNIYDTIQAIDYDPERQRVYALGWSGLFRLDDLKGNYTKVVQVVESSQGPYCACFAGSENYGIVVVRNFQDSSYCKVYRIAGGQAIPIDFKGQLTQLPSTPRNNVCIDRSGYMYVVAANSNSILYSADSGITWQTHGLLTEQVQKAAPGADMQTIKVSLMVQNGQYQISAFIGTTMGGVFVPGTAAPVLLKSSKVDIQATWSLSYDFPNDRLFALYYYDGFQSGTVLPYSQVNLHTGNPVFIDGTMASSYAAPQEMLAAIAGATRYGDKGMYFVGQPSPDYAAALIANNGACKPTAIPQVEAYGWSILAMHQHAGVLYLGHMQHAGVRAYHEADLFPNG